MLAKASHTHGYSNDLIFNYIMRNNNPQWEKKQFERKDQEKMKFRNYNEVNDGEHSNCPIYSPV